MTGLIEMRCDERCIIRIEMYNLEISVSDMPSGFIYLYISLFNSISGRSRFTRVLHALSL